MLGSHAHTAWANGVKGGSMDFLYGGEEWGLAMDELGGQDALQLLAGFLSFVELRGLRGCVDSTGQ